MGTWGRGWTSHIYIIWWESNQACRKNVRPCGAQWGQMCVFGPKTRVSITHLVFLCPLNIPKKVMRKVCAYRCLCVWPVSAFLLHKNAKTSLTHIHTYTHIVLPLSQDRPFLSIFCVSKKVMRKVCAYRCLCVRAVSAFFTLQKLHTYTPTHIPHLHIHTYLCPKTRWLK